MFPVRCNQALPNITSVWGIFLRHASHEGTNSQNSFLHQAVCCGACEPQLFQYACKCSSLLAVHAGDATHLQRKSSQKFPLLFLYRALIASTFSAISTYLMRVFLPSKMVPYLLLETTLTCLSSAVLLETGVKLNFVLNLRLFLQDLYSAYVGRDSSVGVVTHYGLDGPGIESR